jgi:hypothetical protein
MFLPGFLRIPFCLCFRRNFSQERGFGVVAGIPFAGIPVGQEFLYLPRSGGFRRIPVRAKSCWLWPATKEGA